MIRLTSAAQARELKGRIPELVIRRMEQFEGCDGLFDPARHGHLIFIGEAEDITTLPEISETGLLGILDPECPGYEFLEATQEDGQTVWEMTVPIDDERTIAVFFVESPSLDRRLAQHLDWLTGRGESPP